MTSFPAECSSVSLSVGAGFDMTGVLLGSLPEYFPGVMLGYGANVSGLLHVMYVAFDAWLVNDEVFLENDLLCSCWAPGCGGI